MDAEQRIAILERAMAKVRRLSPHYDDVLRDVSARISANCSVGKGDIAMLAFWKRIPTKSWAEDFLSLPELEVRDVTSHVVVAARERDLIVGASKARELLRKLPGFVTGSAMSSAVLTAIRPTDLAIYDRHANQGLKWVELSLAGNQPEHYAEYMRRVEQCRSEAKALKGYRWSGHEVDLALYLLGKSHRSPCPDHLDANEWQEGQ
jgi:hypothetical protein